MTQITIPISDDRFARLRAWADTAGLSPEEFLHRRIDQLLDKPEEQFQQAANYFVEKNADLYRRLA